MSDEALRQMVAQAVRQLRAATELTMTEIIGIGALPEASRTPEVCHALGVLDGAAAALRATRQEMLDDLDLLTAPRRATRLHDPANAKPS
jgi:hypothetical protein